MFKKRFTAILLSLVMLLCCAAAFAEGEAPAVCVYTIYNVTGEKVVELYLTDNNSGEQSENFAGEEGLANQSVIEMLEAIYRDPNFSIPRVIERAKDKDDPFKLMGFGHRVYKTFDPRAKIAKKVCHTVMEHTGHKDPLLDIALKLEEAALNDPYFQQRNLYPNVDFYTGLSYRAMGIPTNMFTVIFAMGRLPGWIAQYLEMRDGTEHKIFRPRQLYVGPEQRSINKDK